ncbi:MAG: hypothetical protein JJ969_00810 [Rhizobiaceae bacterium]|nr:hypothetical protein [Rhizobiaceae bacterium]MBO6726933.1 hypothetical protein [Rhizobiaceae bacterium]
MTRLFGVLLRLVVILVGYSLAVLMAVLFIHVLAWGSLGFGSGTEDPVAQWATAISVLLSTLFISYYAFLPSAVLITISEMRAIRSWLYFALSGGAVALCVVVLRAMDRTADSAVVPVDAVTIAAGLAGGIAYWLIAGRNAGGWRQRNLSAPEPSES